MKKRILQVVLFCSFFFCTEIAFGLQSSSNPRPVQEHDAKIHYAEDGRVFLYKQSDYFLWISRAVSQPSLYTPVGEDNEPDSFSLQEGRVEIGIIQPDGTTETKVFYADGTAPQTFIRLENAPTYQVDDVTFFGKNLTASLSATDNLSGVFEIFVSRNGEEYRPTRDTLRGFDRDGLYALDFYAVDNVGNVSEIKRSEFTIDIESPSLSWDVNGPRNVNILAADATIELSAEDNLSGVSSIEYRLNDDPFIAYDTPIQVNDLDDGEHSLFAISTDNVDNQSSELRYDFFLDTTPPELSYNVSGPLYESGGISYISDVSRVELIAVDAFAGVSSLRYSINNRENQDYSRPFSPGREPGTYSITYQSEDMVGNTSGLSSVRFYLDTAPPETNYAFDGAYFRENEGYIITPETEVVLDPVDLESGIRKIEYRINDSEWMEYDEPLTFAEDGTYRISYRTTDNVGNAETDKLLTISIDSQRQISFDTSVVADREPQTQKYILQNDEIYGAQDLPFYIHISTSDSDTAQTFTLIADVDNAPNFPTQFDSPGTNQLSISVDGIRQSFKIITDQNPPATSREFTNAERFQSGEQLIYSNSVQFNLSAEDDISEVDKILYSEDGGAYQPYERPLSGFFTERQYLLSYYAIDKVGNEEDIHTHEFWVDATPPRTRHQLLNNFSGITLSPQTEIMLEASDNLAGVRNTYYAFNDEDPKLYTGTIRLSNEALIPNGMQTLQYYSVDNVGNTEQTNRFNFRFHISEPVINYSWLGNHYKTDDLYYVNADTRLSLNTETSIVDIESISYRIDGGTQQTFNEPFNFSRTGRQNIQYNARDVVGNVSESYTLEIIMDQQPPRTNSEIQGNRITEAGKPVLGSGALIFLSASDDQAGVQQIQYSVNNAANRTYSSPVEFNRSGDYTLRYFATDRVGNREDYHEIEFSVDISSPEINLEFTPANPTVTSDGVTIINSNTLITVKAVDAHTDVESVYYQIGDNEPSVYLSPLSEFQSGEEYSITFIARDLLGNEQTVLRRFRVD